jgi:hypothetical protein
VAKTLHHAYLKDVFMRLPTHGQPRQRTASRSLEVVALRLIGNISSLIVEIEMKGVALVRVR